MSVLAYVGLGSNLDNPSRQLTQALSALSATPDVTLLAVSPFYQSRAIGPGEQPDYVNAVAAIETTLPALCLLSALQAIEHRQGRVRSEQRWMARTLDLDILLFGGQVLDTERLTLPHPRIAERNFVLRPLLDIAPDVLLPDGRNVADLLTLCSSEGIELLA